MSYQRNSHGRDRTEIEAIKARIRIEDVAGASTRLRRSGRELVGLSPFKPERTPSFFVDPAKGTFYCFATAQGGDVIRLVELVHGITTAQAIEALARDSGIGEMSVERKSELARERAARQAAADAEDQRRRDRMAAFAADVVHASMPAAGTSSEAYLRSRGIDLAALADVYGWTGGVPPSLRHVPRLEYRDQAVKPARVVHTGPAMIGLIGIVPWIGEPRGVHRTWINPSGSGKALIWGAPDAMGTRQKLKPKLTLGDVWGAAGWLSDGAAHLVVGEGYETTLSVVGVLAKAGRRVASCSALSLGNMAGAGVGRGRPHPDAGRAGQFLPSTVPHMTRPGIRIPDGVAEITILADNDGRDPVSTEALVNRAAARWRREGYIVRVAWPRRGMDFNDMVARGAGADDVLARVTELA